MKKWKGLLLAGLLVLTSISIFAWSRDRPAMRPYQEVAVLSLANKFIDAACYEPKKVLDIFQGTFIPQSMLDKASDYLDNLIIVQGECFGHSREEVQNDISHELSNLTSLLLRSGMGTEFDISDFYDCLYVTEESFTNLPNATKEIFGCIDAHLDVRGFLRDVFKKPEPYKVTNPIIVEPIEVHPPDYVYPPDCGFTPGPPYIYPPDPDYIEE